MKDKAKVYKEIENLGWKAFSLTGDINDYGMIVSAREKQKELQKGVEEENQPGAPTAPPVRK